MASCNIGELLEILKSYIVLYDDEGKKYLNSIVEICKEDDVVNIKLLLMLITKCINDHGLYNGDNLISEKLMNKNIQKCLEDPLISSKGNCDLSLYNLILLMRLDILLIHIKNEESSVTINIDKKIKLLLDDANYSPLTSLLEEDITATKTLSFNKIKTTLNIADLNNLAKSIIKILNKLIDKQIYKDITEKIQIYTILYVLIKKIYTNVNNDTINTSIRNIYESLIKGDNSSCAPRSFISIKPVVSGGYNNKSGDIDYHICKANFKQTFKKVSAKSSREAAKMVAMKVLKGNKKSIKFSLKRMIGKKEKCYDYDVSIDKSGKIIIKNQ